jgi:hypothetical protein
MHLLANNKTIKLSNELFSKYYDDCKYGKSLGSFM